MAEVRACQVCGSKDLTLLFDMGMQPVPEGAAAGKRYPLRLIRCDECTLVQLDYVVPQEELFAKDHPYSTGNSGALIHHYALLAEEIRRRIEPGRGHVVDIGANDCTLLNMVGGQAGTRTAVEPTDQVKKAGEGVTRWQDFFTWDVACKIREQHGPAQVVTACNVLAHVPDVHDFLDGVTELLGHDGVFITENHDLYSVLDGNQLDTIYHEHLRYYSVASLSRLLEAHDFRVERVIQVPTHGGSFRIYACKRRGSFPASARFAATALRGMLYKITQQERKVVYGIGAATRATPLIHYSGIKEFITAVCEVPGSDKLGQVMPGTTIPVVDDQRLIEDQPAYALLLAWHNADIIVPRLRERGYQGKFIVPLPQPKVIDD